MHEVGNIIYVDFKEEWKMEYAILTNEKDYTIFKFKDYVLKFKAPKCLERYDKVTKWDNGFIVVMTKYSHSKELIEEYIDLSPVLNDLLISKEKIKDIEEVRVINE